MTRVSQPWDYIEIWGFCEDIKGINLMMMMITGRRMTRQKTTNKDDDNNKDDNDDMGISALWLDRDVGFLWGHQGRQGQWSHDDEEEDEVEDNNIEHDNNKDNIYFAWKCLNLKGICQLKNLENFS